jgi:hypothetical protein
MLCSRLPLRPAIAGFMVGMLLFAVGGEAQTATAQGSSFDSDQPIQSLKQATLTAESDSHLVALATALQKARADTEISFGEYREGVQIFQQNHPGFYGNFFGDPFYATYDVRYSRLTWKRQFAEPDINPQNSFRNNDWFFCSPFAYDPAFNGQCRGFTFLASDFFFLPSGPAFGPQELASRRERVREHLPQRDTESRIRRADSAPPEPDTSRTPIADAPMPDRPEPGRSVPAEIETTGPVESESGVDLVSAPNEISVPDKITAPERAAEATPDRAPALSRIRELVRRQQNGAQLSAKERREVMSTLQHMVERQNTGRIYSDEVRSPRLQRQVESLTDRNRAHNGRSPRISTDVVNRPQIDRVELDRSASKTVRRNRSDARSDNSSSRDRSKIENSSDDETEN